MRAELCPPGALGGDLEYHQCVLARERRSYLYTSSLSIWKASLRPRKADAECQGQRQVLTKAAGRRGGGSVLGLQGRKRTPTESPSLLVPGHDCWRSPGPGGVLSPSHSVPGAQRREEWRQRTEQGRSVRPGPRALAAPRDSHLALLRSCLCWEAGRSTREIGPVPFAAGGQHVEEDTLALRKRRPLCG